MIFFVGNDGQIIKTLPSPVYQGESNANTVYLVAPFAVNTAVTVAFQLPNGVRISPQPMTPQSEVRGVVEAGSDRPYAVWTYSLPNPITQFYGAVAVQFFFYAPSGAVVASSSTNFTVGKGVPATLPEAPDDTVYELILQNISALKSRIENGFAGFADTMQTETETLSPESEATVEVVPLDGTPNGAKQFLFRFGIPKGEKGEKGDTGREALTYNGAVYTGGNAESDFIFELQTEKFNRKPLIGEFFNVIGMDRGTGVSYMFNMKVTAFRANDSVVQVRNQHSIRTQGERGERGEKGEKGDTGDVSKEYVDSAISTAITTALNTPV